MNRSHNQCIPKTFRFPPDVIEDVERVLYYARHGDKPKYPSMINLLLVALGGVIKRERKKLEDQGVVWDSLEPVTKQLKGESENG